MNPPWGTCSQWWVVRRGTRECSPVPFWWLPDPLVRAPFAAGHRSGKRRCTSRWTFQNQPCINNKLEQGEVTIWAIKWCNVVMKIWCGMVMVITNGMVWWITCLCWIDCSSFIREIDPLGSRKSSTWNGSCGKKFESWWNDDNSNSLEVHKM